MNLELLCKMFRSSYFLIRALIQLIFFPMPHLACHGIAFMLDSSNHLRINGTDICVTDNSGVPMISWCSSGVQFEIGAVIDLYYDLCIKSFASSFD